MIVKVVYILSTSSNWCKINHNSLWMCWG